jgi:4'-phosphopantetheinyl transferase EntD
MPPDAGALERAFSALAPGLRVAVADQPCPRAQLTLSERRRCEAFMTEARQDSWLRGRAALKQLLEALGEPAETAALAFPHPRVSLTHSGGYAVAVGSHDPALRGVGVDLELRPALRRETARWFLGPHERRWLARCRAAEAPSELLRLWTVKEAVFKADPRNQGRVLASYRLPAPAGPSGMAAVAGAPGSFEYVSVAFGDGALSAAVSRA